MVRVIGTTSDGKTLLLPPRLLAVTVRLYVPARVLAEVPMVRMVEPPPVRVAGLKFAAAPLGAPDTEKLTEPLKPFNGVTVIVYAAVAPETTVAEPLFRLMLKSCTTKDADAGRAKAPLCVLMIKVAVPTGVEPLVVMVRVVWPPPVKVAGLKLGV